MYADKTLLLLSVDVYMYISRYSSNPKALFSRYSSNPKAMMITS